MTMRAKKMNTKMPQETGAFVCSILISRMVSEFAINKNVLSLREEVKFSGGRIVVKCIVRHHEAIQYLYGLIEHDKRQTISERLIRSLQQLVIKDIEDQESGQYRKGNVMITGSSHRPPEAYEVPKLMEELVTWVKTNQSKMHPVELAALVHHKLVHIHPFTDGNGRTARLFMNLTSMKKGYPMVIILKNDRQKYYRALDRADRGDKTDIEKLIAQAVERSMNIYVKVIKSGASKNEKLVRLSGLTKKSGFSEKYLNLLARSGKLDAHKEGRVWLSSQKALESYLQERERKRSGKKK